MFLKIAGSCLALLSSTLMSQTPSPGSPDPFPELTPRASLIAILKGLDSTIADPRSVTDVILCPATRVKYSKAGDGRPESWYVAFSMNARTAAGGYMGRTMYGAVFKAGRPPRIARAQMNTDEGFDHIINSAIAKQMKDCPSVSNEQLSALLGSSDRPVVDVSR